MLHIPQPFNKRTNINIYNIFWNSLYYQRYIIKTPKKLFTSVCTRHTRIYKYKNGYQTKTIAVLNSLHFLICICLFIHLLLLCSFLYVVWSEGTHIAWSTCGAGGQLSKVGYLFLPLREFPKMELMSLHMHSKHLCH